MGMLVVLEGIDGSGKGTQARLLVDALARRGFTARLFSFPCYDETFFGREVGRYLNGAFGDLHSVPPEFAALLYAGDRLEKRDELLVALRDADVVVCDRYVPSNFAHQAAKLPRERQDALIDWIAAVEYTVFGLPRPDLVCLLTMPPERSVALVLNKNRRSYTEKRLDLHEAAGDYLQDAAQVFARLAERNGWTVIDGMAGGAVRSIQAVGDELLGHVLAALRARGAAAGGLPGKTDQAG